MLKFLRNKHTQKKIYIVLALLVIPSFFIFGINLSSPTRKNAEIPSVGSVIREIKIKKSHTLGAIDNKKFSIEEYLNSYKAVKNEVALMYGQKSKDLESRINYKGEAWDRILLLYHAKQKNIRAADAEVVQWITSQPAFQNHGQFDDNIYKLYVNSYLHSSARVFEEEIRDFLTIQKIVDQMRSKVVVKDDELKTLYNQQNGQRDLLYGVLPWESQKSNIKVTDDDLKSIYPLVKDKLTDPERVKISYLFVPLENKEPLKAIFDEKDMTLDALSKKYSLPVKETGFFSKNEAVPEIGLSQDVLFASFSLPLNQESDWFQLDKGSYKIKVTDKKAERPLNLEEAKEELTKVLTKEKATQNAAVKINEARKKMQSSDLEPILKELGIEAKRAEKYKKGDYLPEMGPSENTEKVITQLKEGEVSEVFVTPNGAAILKIVKDSAIDDKKFEAEKETFKEKVLREKSSNEVRKLLDGLREKLKIDIETMKKLFASEEKP